MSGNVWTESLKLELCQDLDQRKKSREVSISPCQIVIYSKSVSVLQLGKKGLIQSSISTLSKLEEVPQNTWLYIPWHMLWQTRPDYKTHSSSDWMSIKPQGLKLSASLLTNNLSLSEKDGSQFHFYQKQVEAKQIKFLEARDWNPHRRPVLCPLSNFHCWLLLAWVIPMDFSEQAGPASPGERQPVWFQEHA